MRIVVDDALLLAVISEQAGDLYVPYLEAAARNEVFTTSSWLWRLSRAVSRGGPGALSGLFQRLSESDQRRVRSSLARLPAGIGLVDPRTLVPVMAAVAGQLNFLTAEAVAAAVIIEGKLAVTTRSELLAGAARDNRVGVEVVDLM